MYYGRGAEAGNHFNRSSALCNGCSGHVNVYELIIAMSYTGSNFPLCQSGLLFGVRANERVLVSFVSICSVLMSQTVGMWKHSRFTFSVTGMVLCAATRNRSLILCVATRNRCMILQVWCFSLLWLYSSEKIDLAPCILRPKINTT